MSTVTQRGCQTKQPQGVGIGFRHPHAAELIRRKPPLGWLEVLADNYFAEGGLAHRQLADICAHYPITVHSVGMSLGSIDPPDFSYLQKIKNLAKRHDALSISDHLCFVSADNVRLHDLLPLPHTEEAVRHTASKIRQVQDFFEQRILIENISSYLTYQSSVMGEVEFLNAVATEADCDILLDLNNLYVSAYNHKYDVQAMLRGVNAERVRQIHLGGFEDKGVYLLDAHNHRVAGEVWDLLARLASWCSDIPVLIEWDNDLPALDVLLDEARHAERVMQQTQHAMA